MNQIEKGAIGVFDSGFGGIDILKDLVRLLPGYNFIYFGDTARNPYGTRTQQTIFRFTKQGVEFLFEKGAKLVVLACNTASSQALPLFENRDRILGIIEPTVKRVSKKNPKRVGVIGTDATIRSNIFKEKFKELNPEIQVFQTPTPLLVPLVEEGEEDSEMARLAVKKYLTPLLKKEIGVLILGCTHLGVLEGLIRKEAGTDVEIIKEGEIMGQELRHHIKKHPEIEKRLGKEGKVSFYSTDLTQKFVSLGSKFFGREIRAKKAEI